MRSRDLDLFRRTVKLSDRISENSYRVTTSKRESLVPPKGVSLFDTDLNKWFNGDGTTYGGVPDSAKARVRKVAVNAAASGGLSASATTDKITWGTYGGKLRTGDAVTLAAGTGTLPSGTSATTYWVVKDSTTPTSDSFKIATSRANAVSGVPVTVDILSSGVPGWTSVINTIGVGGFEDVLILDPCAAAVDVALPYPTTSNDGLQVTVKRAAAGETATVKMVAANESVGTLTADDAAANISLTSGSIAKGYTFFADGASNEYFVISKVTA